MMESTHLALPWLAAGQAQKHVTVNEALRRLDGIVQASVVALAASPPANPAEGARYIVGDGATGAWAGWDGSIAYRADDAWYRLAPAPGWRVWVEDETDLRVWTGTEWLGLDAAMGLVKRSAVTTLAEGPAGGRTDMGLAEELLAELSGASVDSTIAIPNRAIVLGVSTRTVTAVTGASAYDCGIAGSPAKFGGSLGAAAGSTNVGVIGPQAFYTDTPIRLTANGADFTGGDVRIAIHYLLPNAPTG